ncbi:hypothetical protein U1Q18_048830 [Sarracenia purpurea var. burkii]
MTRRGGDRGRGRGRGRISYTASRGRGGRDVEASTSCPLRQYVEETMVREDRDIASHTRRAIAERVSSIEFVTRAQPIEETPMPAAEEAQNILALACLKCYASRRNRY